MMEPLPTHDFHWSGDSIEDIMKTYLDSQHGYFLEVDLEYPQNLHDKHSDYPLAPETLKVNEWLSDYHCTLIDELMEVNSSIV
jgi:hypothetical protein